MQGVGQLELNPLFFTSPRVLRCMCDIQFKQSSSVLTQSSDPQLINRENGILRLILR